MHMPLLYAKNKNMFFSHEFVTYMQAYAYDLMARSTYKSVKAYGTGKLVCIPTSYYE